MKKIKRNKTSPFLFPAALAVVFISSILIIVSPFGSKTLVPLPTPTPTPIVDTSTWKTYTDKTYGFSFKYPPEYLVESGHGLSYDTIYLWKSISEKNECTKNDLCILPETKLLIYNHDQVYPQDSINITLGDNLYNYSEEIGMSDFGFYILKSNPKIEFLTLEHKLYKNDPIFSQILSTFKFTQ
jgi:hypothetical protein